MFYLTANLHSNEVTYYNRKISIDLYDPEFKVKLDMLDNSDIRPEK